MDGDFEEEGDAPSFESVRGVESAERLVGARQEYYAFLNVKKGFEGEIRYDKKLVHLKSDVLAINDLALTQNGKYRQIDALLWTPTGIATFELKNYEGDFVYNDGKLFTSSRKEIENPLHQVDRANVFLRNILSGLGYHGTVDSYLVFINENFHLYQSPLGKNILYPHQLDKLFDQMNSLSAPLSKKDRELAEKLVSMHCPNSPFENLPEYTYDELHKGIGCLIAPLLICNWKLGISFA